MNEKYEKIINLPHHVSVNRAQMSNSDRAAQFAPYSALSGYEDAVEETARLTDRKIELDEYEKEKINAALYNLLTSSTDEIVKITFFRPDKHKAGGAYVTATGKIGKFDEITHEITMIGGTPIKLDDIIDVEEIPT